MSLLAGRVLDASGREGLTAELFSERYGAGTATGVAQG